MITREELERELHNALAHLNDPNYQPSETFCAVASCDPQDGVFAVQTAILRAIEGLKPPPEVPSTAHTKRTYDVLHKRFVLQLTQEETAAQLHVSRTSINRMQRQAMHILARTLWESSQERQRSERDRARAGGEQPAEGEAQESRAPDWHTQMERELASLRAQAPDAVTTVTETIEGVLELRSRLVSERDTAVEVESVQPDLVAAIHDSVLRQILITGIRQLAQYISTGPITIRARLEDGYVKIAMTGVVTSENTPSESDLVRDVLTPAGVSVEAHLEGKHAFLWVELPSSNTVTVLVVDDNPDMADLYRRSTEGTSYHIVHIAQGQGLFETVEATGPDVIVLDVMLPDIDGWRLLMRLYENPATRPIPVIVCSVVREKKLALSLGAALYLSKPVRPREFIQALDQVLSRTSATALISPESTSTA